VLISQLALVVVILALVTGAFAWIGARTVTEVTETKALATARTLAIDPDVRPPRPGLGRARRDPG
jgi:two-component system CitB family sensor kinase